MNLSSTIRPNETAIDAGLLNDSQNLHSRIALSVWLGFVAVFGFIGNLLIVTMVVMYPKLRTITNVYVTSLATADMMSCLSIPFMIVGIVSITGWPLSDASCVVVAIVSFVCYGASVWHLAVIGFNRMVLITMTSSTYRKIFSKRNVVLFLISTWFIPLTVILVPYLAGSTRLGYDAGTHLCTDVEDNGDGSKNLIHTYMQATFLTCFPLLIVLIFYARIYLHVRKHEKRLGQWKLSSNNKHTSAPETPAPSAVTNQTLTQCTPIDATHETVVDTAQAPSTSASFSVCSVHNSKAYPAAANKNKDRRSLEYRITKNAFCVVLGFLLCVIPYGICVLSMSGPEGTPLAVAFILFNSCLNPLIYGTKHPQFRASLRNLLRARFNAPLVISNEVSPTDQ